MKLVVRDRILLFLYALCGAALSLFIAMLGLLTDFIKPGVDERLGALVGSPFMRMLVGILGLAWLCYSLWMMYICLNTRRYMPGDQTVAIQNSANGSIRVSVTALDTMVQKSIKQVTGLANVRTSIKARDESVDVKLNLNVLPGVVIPEVTTQLQTRVKSYIEKHAGIPIGEVEVLIEEVTKGEEILSTAQPIEPDEIGDSVTPVVEDAEVPLEGEVESAPEYADESLDDAPTGDDMDVEPSEDEQ